MARVLDCPNDCSAKAAGLIAAGYDTVIRYYSMSAWKRLGAAEAQALCRAGLKLGVVYQDRQNCPDDFSQAKGTLAGQNAFHYAQTTIFQPANSAIYFSVDFDPTLDVVNNQVVPFFQGVRTAFLAGNGGTLPYRIGVYGSGRTCRILLAQYLVELCWLTQSKGFAEYQEFLNSGNWNLSQAMPATILGLDCDPDDVNPAKADFGAFALGNDHFGPALPTNAASRYTVAASSGLNLRGGPGNDFAVLDVLASGTAVSVIGRNGDWAQVDVSGDGQADGYVFSSYLKPA